MDIPVIGNNLNAALNQLKRHMKASRKLDTLRRKERFTPRSVTRRDKWERAHAQRLTDARKEERQAEKRRWT